MVWIYKSITCSQKPWIIPIVTLCEGKWGVERGLSVAIFVSLNIWKQYFQCDAMKSHNLATNLASELLTVTR